MNLGEIVVEISEKRLFKVFILVKFLTLSRVCSFSKTPKFLKLVKFHRLTIFAKAHEHQW